MHSTLREMRHLARDGRSWAVLAVLSLVAGMIGPFGTYAAIGLLPRIAYWTAIVMGSGISGTLIASLLERQLKPRVPFWLASGLAGAAAGPPVAALVALVNLGVFGARADVIDLLTLTIYCTLISVAVTLLSAFLGARPKPEAGKKRDLVDARLDVAVPALLERLPPARRGKLLHIAVSDHYVDVATDRGTTMVLMRLSDAIREATPTPGLQVHRSHWVALDAVESGRRENGKPVLRLTNGTLVPVSRTYAEAVRAAGLMS